jgi:protein-tyrosine phosphatase
LTSWPDHRRSIRKTQPCSNQAFFKVVSDPISIDHPAMSHADKPYRILFVCLGNICRSPAAEIVFRHQVAQLGRQDDFVIDSAGTIGFHAGAAPDPRMCDALTRHGFTITGRSRQIDAADLETFDLIVTMDESNLSDVRQLDPAGIHHAKIRPFVGFCRMHGDPRVPDPYYGGQRGFDHVIALLKDGCQGILEEIGDR